jgi:DNA polymerase (family X)
MATKVAKPRGIARIQSMSLNNELSDLFANFAAILQIKGEPVFKCLAFQKVSRLMKETAADIRKAVEDGTIGDLEGIGPSSRRIIEEFVKTGRSTDYEAVAASVPAGLLPMLNIPGMGPKTIQLLWKERKIENVEMLLAAIEAGKLDGLKGIGPKKIDAIKAGIALRARGRGRMSVVEALPVAQAIVERLRKIAGVQQAEIAGSLRRRRETIGDVDLICAVATVESGEKVARAFVEFPEVEKVLGQGTTKASILTESGLQVDVRLVPAMHFGAALQYFTGSKEHNVRLRSLANDKQMTLNEWGLYRLADYDKAEKKVGLPPSAKPVASRTEEEIYSALGLQTPDPLLREDRGEIAAAAAGKLPKLIELSDIRGDLHMHTTASDGKNSIAEMAESAAKLGYQYVCITDHSKTQAIAGGLTAERLLAHVKEIHRVGEKFKNITILAGCEVDILADGKLDFEDSVLAELDFIVASPHMSLRQDQQKATARLLRAIENPYANVIGHPSGRLIDQREGLPLDFGQIIKAAAQTGTALEINASWPRFDLDDIHAKAAIDGGVKLAIDTDAHSIEGLNAMPFGICVARRGWVKKTDVINCLPIAQLRELVVRKRKRK